MADITEDKLKRWFLQFNDQYFEGRIVEYKILIQAPPEPLQKMPGLCDRKSKTIYLAEWAIDREEMAKNLLLHEMTHAFLNLEPHSPRFEKELIRLKNEGAPILDQEVDEIARININAAYIRESIDELLLDEHSLEEAQEMVTKYCHITKQYLIQQWPRSSHGSASVDTLKKREEMYPYNFVSAREIATRLREQGKTYRAIADVLKEEGYKNMRGHYYSVNGVRYLLSRGTNLRAN